MRGMRTVVQIVLLGAVWLAASYLVDAFSLPLSAGVLGLLFVLALLLSRVVRVDTFKGGADWLLNELILFFIPSVVAVMKYFQLFRQEGVQLVFAIAVGTLLVMVSTAFAVHAGVKLEARLRRRFRTSGAYDAGTGVS
ncbi:CidA/LrgA family protein [Burkholderia cenocepacia]|nr:CidA/LrgA family protein [Burkholderia cenocepacia]